MSLFRFWRKSIPELMKDYLILKAKADTARDFYRSIPINERKNRFQTFKKWLKLYIETNRYMIEVVNRFSPRIARTLKSQITGYSERTEELLKEEHWESPKYAIFTEERLNELITEMLDNSLEYADVNEKEVYQAFIVVFDTLRRVKGELPLEPWDKIKNALAKYNPRLVRMYEGAYRALESDNPERYRHCSVSMREIVKGILGNTVDERMEFIRSHVESKGESEILKSLDGLIRSINKSWNKGVHSEIQYETAILAIQATELIISYIFRLEKDQ